MKWNRGRETIVYKFDRWNFFFFIRFFSPYIFFPPRRTTDHSINGPPMIQLRRGKNEGSVRSIWFLAMLLRETKILQFIRLRRIRLLFRVLFPFVGSITHNLTFFASKSIGKFSNNIFRRVKPWKEIESSLCVCVLIKRKLTQSSIVLYIYIRIFHSLSLFEFHYFDIFEDCIELVFPFIYDYSS